MAGIIPYIDYSHTYSVGTQINGQVFISLKDADTGLPVNGNNIIVYYKQILGGIETDGLQATIPGQGIAIYSGLLQDSSVPYYTSFFVTGQSAVPNPSPPVAQCDLAINGIEVLQNESSLGAADGKIKVNATSSYAPIQYSLDNATWQVSPIFTGLESGLQTVYAKDANTIIPSCLETATVTVPVNKDLLVSDPGVVVGGNTSRWNAAFNPIVFQYQRKDFEIIKVLISTINGNALVYVNADLTGVNIGDYVYINAGNYKGTYQVQNTAENTIVINTTYNGNTTGWINIDSLRPYYKVYTKISYNDPISGKPLTALVKSSVDAAGVAKTNIKNFLQSLLQAKDDSQYNLVNYRDMNLSASYRISYAEHWEDGTTNTDGSTGHTDVYFDLPDTYYVTFAARQLGQKYGGNMAEFVPFKTLAAKWLTDFAEPVYSLAYPFDLSFIYGEDLAGLQLYYKIQLLDINRNVINQGTAITSFLLNEDSSFLLNEDGSKLIIEQQQFSNVPIVEHVGLNRLLIDNAFDPEVYYFKIGIYYDATPDDDTTAVQVLSDQVVRIDKNCDFNSVYMRWLGLTGSWNYYRFIYNQEHMLDVQNAALITRYVDDWEDGDTIEDVITKAASVKVTVHAEDALKADIEGMKALKAGCKVQICTNQAPAKWQTVIVNTASFAESETNMDVYPVTITFNMPSLNLQTQ